MLSSVAALFPTRWEKLRKLMFFPCLFVRLFWLLRGKYNSVKLAFPLQNLKLRNYEEASVPSKEETEAQNLRMNRPFKILS